MLEEQDERLRAANADLERASKAKSDFPAKMSHEIRTPINAVLGMEEMVLLKYLPEGKIIRDE